MFAEADADESSRKEASQERKKWEVIILRLIFAMFVAQLVAQLPPKQEIRGSNPESGHL